MDVPLASGSKGRPLRKLSLDRIKIKVEKGIFEGGEGASISRLLPRWASVAPDGGRLAEATSERTRVQVRGPYSP